MRGGWQHCSFPDGAATDSPLHFTGKPRDAETGLDFFGARYYSSTLGRWMTPDWSATPEAVPYADLSDPQTLNLYAYAGNNPVTRSDADGHTPLDWIWKSAGHMMQEVGFAFHLWTGPNAGGCTTARCTVTVMAKPAAASTVALVDPRTTWALVRNDIRLWWASRGCHPGQLCGGTVLPLEGGLEEGAEALLEDGGETAAARSTTLQTGGRTLSKSTAGALNRQFGVELEPRQWGRALEDLKDAHGLRNDVHGKVMSNGDYVDPKTGSVLGNIGDFIHR